jgi:hypothetical protein
MAAAKRIPVIVIDRLCEWTVGHEGATSVAEAVQHIERGRRLVIVRPPDPTPPDWTILEASAAARWAKRYPDTAGVAVPEAHRVLPNGGRLPEVWDDVTCAWRHHGVAVWLDSQRLAKLHKDVTEQAAASDLRIFAILGERDLETARELGGRDLVRCVTEAATRYGRGERGWHVRLTVGVVPPYTLQRAP